MIVVDKIVGIFSVVMNQPNGADMDTTNSTTAELTQESAKDLVKCLQVHLSEYKYRDDQCIDAGNGCGLSRSEDTSIDTTQMMIGISSARMASLNA